MTIDEADTILSCERLNSSMGCGASDEDIDEALGVAIDIMYKYQKIEQLVKFYKNAGEIPIFVLEGVLKDGNDDYR